MARFAGEIGYGTSVETPPDSGVWVDTIVEKTYFGDLIRNVRKSQEADQRLNNNLSLSNSISIVADAYANENFIAIRYVTFAGQRWTVTDVEVQSPRLILSLGEVYNGPTPT